MMLDGLGAGRLKVGEAVRVTTIGVFVRSAIFRLIMG